MILECDTNDLVLCIDIADRLGVCKSTVPNWVVRHLDFPKPLFYLGRKRIGIYSFVQVKKWADETGHPG